MLILKRENKIIDFLMILAWLCRFIASYLRSKQLLHFRKAKVQ